jgi:EpsI family protein
MKYLSFVHLVLGAVLIIAMLAGMGLTPTHRLAAEQSISLETLIPKSFANWQLDPRIAPVSVSREVQAKLDKIYNQVLSRTYVNSGGEMIMLSVAYGGNQIGESLQVHRPEYCYAAQGFQVLSGVVDALSTRFGSLSVRRVVATKGPRHEPITYWLTVGDKATLPGWRRKLVQIGYGLSGRIPDGMLVRISSISPDNEEAYKAQDEFIRALLDRLRAEDRVKVMGAITQ